MAPVRSGGPRTGGQCFRVTLIGIPSCKYKNTSDRLAISELYNNPSYSRLLNGYRLRSIRGKRHR